MRALQCARATAALLVVYFHAVIQMGKLEGWSSDPYILFGESGVDVFFCLSGFLMWRSTRHDPYPALLFYKKRIARIAPLYWLVTLVAAVIALLIPSLLKSTRFDLTHIVASLAFVPWPNPAGAGKNFRVLMTPVIVPGWTLNFEMMFYALFGLTLIGPRDRRLGHVVVLFAGFMAGITLLGQHVVALQFYDPLLVAEFLLGIGAGVLVDQDLRLPIRWAYPLLGAAVLALVGLDVLAPPISRLFYLGPPAVLTIYALAVIELAGGWPRMPWFCYLGDASFSVYLTHVFVLAGLRIGWGVLAPWNPLDGSRLAFLTGAMAASTIFGVVVYRFVERPLGTAANRVLGLQT